MSDENTQIKDLTEMEKLVIGGATNLIYNLISNQIDHIDNHDPTLLDLLATSEQAQEDYIFLKNIKDTTLSITKLISGTFDHLSDEDKASVLKPGMKLEAFCQDVFHALSCGE